MKELKCPKCGNVFFVDEADYASIVSQVKNAEFHEEVERRLSEMSLQKEQRRRPASPRQIRISARSFRSSSRPLPKKKVKSSSSSNRLKASSRRKILR